MRTIKQSELDKWERAYDAVSDLDKAIFMLIYDFEEEYKMSVEAFNIFRLPMFEELDGIPNGIIDDSEIVLTGADNHFEIYEGIEEGTIKVIKD